ncbi:MAG: hypothetical protein Q9170_005551 [Blastenia crenularia]
MDLPTELTLLILEHLTVQDVKRARLVCRNWASCGIGLLVDTVYLSPREKDMEVFEVITQHPVFAKSVKHLVYDSAQFVNLPFDYYCESLYEQLIFWGGGYRSPVDIQELRELLEPSRDIDRHDERIVNGYRHYKRLAREQRNLFSRSWFARARRGLEAMGELRSVALQNTWDMTFFANSDDDQSAWHGMRNETESYEINCEDLFDDTNYGNEHDRNDTENDTSEDVSRLCDMWSRYPLQENDYEGRSPTARSWPLIYHAPMALVSPWPEPRISKPRGYGVSDGSFEVLKLIQLLKSADKQPLEFILPKTTDKKLGIPPVVFDIGKWPESTQFHAICRKLEVFELQIAEYTDDWTSKVFPRLDGLQRMLQEAPGLRKLSLQLPLDQEKEDSLYYSCYRYSQVFPIVKWWRHSTLSWLELSGLRITYLSLVTLLFLELPNLEKLRLAYIVLMNEEWDEIIEGGWDHIIEGLRVSPLSNCQITGPLLHFPNELYLSDEEDWETPLYLDFLAELSRYVNEGGRHPALRDTEPESASAKYVVDLTPYLDDLREDFGYEGAWKV